MLMFILFYRYKNDTINNGAGFRMPMYLMSLHVIYIFKCDIYPDRQKIVGESHVQFD